MIEYVPTAVGAVVDGPYVVPPVPVYVNVAPDNALLKASEPVVTDTVGATTPPNTIDGLDADTVMGRCVTVTFCDVNTWS